MKTVESLLEQLRNFGSVSVAEVLNAYDRVLPDKIYNASKLEGSTITYAQTIELIERNKIGGEGVSAKDLIDLINLKRAWQYFIEIVFDDSEQIGLSLMKRFHIKLMSGSLTIDLEEVGELRKRPVAITGSYWLPEIPENDVTIAGELQEIVSKFSCPIEKALEIYIWGMRRQVFQDGNKRTSNFLANFELMRNRIGFISVPEDRITDFRLHIIYFYETGDGVALKEFLLKSAVHLFANGCVPLDRL